MPLITFSTGSYDTPGFVEKLKLAVFPDLEPENLGFPHARFIQNALITAQTYVECLRNNNIDFYDKGDVQVGCNVASFTGPTHARVQAVYAFKPCGQCTRQHYDQKSVGAVMCYVDQHSECKCRTESDICNAILSGTNYCARDLGPTESAFKCEDKFFAKGSGDKIYLAPMFPCDYMIAVHWEGIKYKYDNSDLITDDEDLQDLIATYLRGERALYIDRDLQLHKEIMRKPERFGDWGGTFWQKLADMKHRCREERRIRKTHACEAIFDDSSLPNFDAAPQIDQTDCEFTVADCAAGQYQDASGACQDCGSMPEVTISTSDASVSAGDTVTISWTSNVPDIDSSEITIEHGGVITPVTRNVNGSSDFVITSDTSFVIRAITDCGEITDTVVVEVADSAPEDDGCGGTEYITSVVDFGSGPSGETPGTIYPNPGTFFGMWFEVTDPSGLTITHLGRWVLEGNTQSHVLVLCDALPGNPPVGIISQTSIDTNGATAGQFLYAALPSPIFLPPGKYSIGSQEGYGDLVYTWDRPVVTTTGIFTPHAWDFTESASPENTDYGPVSFKYCSSGIGGVPQNIHGDQSLINIAFKYSGVTTKTGAAAVGAAGDFWQTYNFAVSGDAEVPNLGLNWSDGSEAYGSSGRTSLATNHPGITGGMFGGSSSSPGSFDVLFDNAATSIVNYNDVRQLAFVQLPTGTYDLIVYTSNSIKCRTKIGGGAYSAYKTAEETVGWETQFANKSNYVMFTDLTISDSTINLYIDFANPAYAFVINGIQLIKRA